MTAAIQLHVLYLRYYSSESDSEELDEFSVGGGTPGNGARRRGLKFARRLRRIPFFLMIYNKKI